MAQNSLIQVRVDDSVKKDADALFADLGFDTPTAIRIFLKQAIKKQGLPFDVSQSIPNADTIAALEEGNRISCDPTTKRYKDFSTLLAEVSREV